MFRLTLIACIVCTACEKRPVQPAGELGELGELIELIDEGALVTTLAGKVTARETFAIRKLDGHLVLTANSATVEDAPHRIVQDGELETDLQYRPRKLSYHYVGGADSFRYVLGGTPLTLDRIRDDGQKPEHIAASSPVDVFVEGPGLIGMTALCRVAQPTTLGTLSDFESGYKGKVVVKTVTPAGKLTKRTIKFLDEFEVELYCEGERLIASGLRTNRLWHVREGRETDLAAITSQE